MSNPDHLQAPWSEDQVASLNAYQECDYLHEYTGRDGVTLIATIEGWRETPDGPVVQTWAWRSASDWSWKSAVDALKNFTERLKTGG